MKIMTAIVATLLASTAFAQGRSGSTGPFTGYEAETLRQVWPEIRQADDFEDINWRAHGLDSAPGSRQAQALLAEHWDEVRREDRFSDIDWDELGDGRSGSRRNRSARSELDRSDTGPFTREEAAVMSRLWGQIREAASYEDINWRAHGVREPGDREAQRIMSRNWDELREAGRFEDIDWNTTLARSRTRVYR